MLPGVARRIVAAAAAVVLALAAATIRAEAPEEREHRSRCWRLEHDSWELPRRIAAGYVWLRRQALRRRREETREQWRNLCTNGR
jgi:hypothetical protein